MQTSPSFTLKKALFVMMMALQNAIVLVNAQVLPLHPTPGNPIVIEAASSTVVTLQKSVPGELLTISKVDNYGSNETSPISKPGGRSYDGYVWESAYPLLLIDDTTMDCSAGTSCQVQLPALDDSTTQRYVLEATTASSPTNQQLVSKLLSQATFGPTEASTQELLTAAAANDNQVNVSDWLNTQINEVDMTSHRAHYRTRSNARLRQASTKMGVYSSCDTQKSRWNQFAFTYKNRGEVLETEEDGINTILKIHNVPFSFVLTADFTASLTITNEMDNTTSLLQPPYVICEVGEYVGAPMVLGSNAVDPDDMMKCMEDNTITTVNPSIVFPSGSSALASLESQGRINNAYMQDLVPSVLDTKLVSAFQTDCSLPKYGPVFVRAFENNNFTGTTQYYIHDHQRVAWEDNTLGSTSLQASNTLRTCTTAKKSFLNEATCQTQVKE